MFNIRHSKSILLSAYFQHKRIQEFGAAVIMQTA